MGLRLLVAIVLAPTLTFADVPTTPPPASAGNTQTEMNIEASEAAKDRDKQLDVAIAGT
jgi:hypothetical protein